MAGRAPWSHSEAGLTSEQPIPDVVDVAIVGAGVTGLSAARSLAQAGATVAVFDADEVGSGATGRSLGVLAAHYPGGPHHIMRRVGSGKATALWIAAAQALEEATSMIEASPTDIESVARTEAGRAQLAADAAWLNERDFDASLNDAGALRTVGALVNPLELTASLADAVRKDGGLVCEAVTVTSVSRHTSGYQVLSSAGKTSADAVVVATGPRPLHAGVPDTEPAVRGVDRFGVSLHLPAAGRPSGCAVMRDDVVTVRRVSDDRVLAAAHRGLRSGRDPDAVAPRLRDLAQELIGSTDAAIEYAWSTPVGLSADATPHVWRNDGMWFGGGYNGDALVPALALGSQLGEVLAGIRTQTIFGGIAPAPMRLRRPGGRISTILGRRRR